MWENSGSFRFFPVKTPRQAKLLQSDRDTVEKNKNVSLGPTDPTLKWQKNKADVASHITSHHVAVWQCESEAAEQSVYCQGPMRAQSLRSHSGPLGWHIFNIFQKRDTQVQQTTLDFFPLGITNVFVNNCKKLMNQQLQRGGTLVALLQRECRHTSSSERSLSSFKLSWQDKKRYVYMYVKSEGSLAIVRGFKGQSHLRPSSADCISTRIRNHSQWTRRDDVIHICTWSVPLIYQINVHQHFRNTMQAVWLLSIWTCKCAQLPCMIKKKNRQRFNDL